MDHTAALASELALRPAQIAAVAALLEEGATIPFIARYRKEAHDGLDEVAITAVRDRLRQRKELEARREAVIKSLQERELYTEELAARIEGASTLTELEDVYLPYRPKKRTRATAAREKGLEPLALLVLEQQPGLDPVYEARAFCTSENGLESAQDALSGARDILAELLTEDPDTRSAVRRLFFDQARISSEVVKDKEAEGAKFKDYFDWLEPAAKAAGHRILAMLRGEKEGVLRLHFLPDPEPALALLLKRHTKNSSPAAEEVRAALEDGYKRLMAPSLETELRNHCREQAETEAIAVFAQNLRRLLLAPPLGQKRVLAIDPGFRTGCKVVCLDAQGTLLHHDVIYLLTPAQQADAGQKIAVLCKKYAVEAVAIGNGTAGRETETLVKNLGLPQQVVMVSESGASVYSASETARKEFPDLDLTIRGAVSIGRRLMDPLAELVKIDPKAIGVGQYQHDVDQTALKNSLTDVVTSCVNAVGVALNTASAELLTYVSGLGPALAANIVAYRESNGPFSNRRALLKVPRLGPKAFEQAAGFLRIPDGDNPLDSSAVHPESYAIVQSMARNLGCTLERLMQEPDLRKRLEARDYVSDAAGLFTVNDILAELEKPGRDPRESFVPFSFHEGVNSIEDLETGMRLPGIITNVTNFGAFVDVGAHQDGLVHISRLADRFIKDPHTVVQVQQQVTVTVLEVDIPRKRISLSMREDDYPAESAPAKAPLHAHQEKADKVQADVAGRRPSTKEKKQSRRTPTSDKNTSSSAPLPSSGSSSGKTSAPESFNNPFAGLLQKK